jgi:hypothetical protein
VTPSSGQIGRAAYAGFRCFVVALFAVQSQSSLRRNVDFLAWFGEDERQVCKSCGERTMVSVPEAVASFCLSCGAVTIDGERLDVDGQLPGLRRWIQKAAGVVRGPDG